MNERHRTIRAILRAKPLPEAREILAVNLPQREFTAIYYADCERETLYDVARRLNCEEVTVKKYRKSGYAKLNSIYFP